MKILYRIFFSSLVFFIANGLSAQCAEPNTQNLTVTSATVEPNPLAPVEENGTGEFCFIFDASQGVTLCSNEEILVIACFNKVMPTGEPTFNNPTPIFDSWEVDGFAANCWVGTISQNLPILSGTQVCFDVVVTENTMASDPPPAQNNMNVNITPHAGDNFGDTDDDTFVSTYTPATVPVELKDFTGLYNRDRNQNELSWTTVTEINSEYFSLQRMRMNSKDEFEEIAVVKAAGNSSADVAYNFMDRDIAESKVYYYRLVQYDWDGKFEILPTVAIKVDRKDDLSFTSYPNPTSDKFTISYSGKTADGLYMMQLFDVNGRLVLDQRMQSRTSDIDMAQLQSGIYLVKVIDASGRSVHAEKLVKL